MALRLPSVEWEVVPAGAACGYRGCPLPSGHFDSCQAAALDGKRRQKPTVHWDATVEKRSAKQKLKLPQDTARCPLVTVWYLSDVGVPEFWHGMVLRACPRRGMLVRFTAMVEGHPERELWVVPFEDEWAWGHGSEQTSGLARSRPQAAREQLQPMCRAQLQGERGWALDYHACVDALGSLRLQMQASGWMQGISVDISLEGIGHAGLTYLVDVSTKLLRRVPLAKWNNRAWPSHGNWSLRLCVSHSPTALLELLELAQRDVIKWPEGAREVLVKLAGTPTYSTVYGVKAPVAVGAGTCFVCGHEAEDCHPHLKAALLCSVCQQRFTDSIWECDSELLCYRCLGCAHEGAAPHGCRSCGSSLCERCVFTLHGPLGLQDARMQRFSMGVTCPVCKQESDPSAPAGMDVRVVCCACRQEWHPRCHCPPLTSLPGPSQRWHCAHCVISGPPRLPSWSMLGCALCEARGGLEPLRLQLRADESIPHTCFDHEAACKKLNANVDAANAALNACSGVLSQSDLEQIAARARERNGVTVASYCDGKGTLLGILLRAGVRVRRYLSIEIDENARRVCRINYGSTYGGLLARDALRFYGDARALSIGDLKSLDCWPVDLLMGATPCNDLSGCNADPDGVHGEESSLIFDFAALYFELEVNNDAHPLAMLFENVRPPRKHHQRDMLGVLGLPPLDSEAAVFEAARRRRWLISNMRFEHVPSNTPNKLMQSVLNPHAVALSDKGSCIITSTLSGAGETVATAKAHSSRNRGRELVLCAPHSTEVRGLLIPEMCRALGQPFNEVDSATGSEGGKANLLGRSLAEGQIRHALQSFITACSK